MMSNLALQEIFQAALARVDPYRMMAEHLRLEGDTLVIDFDGLRQEIALGGRKILVLGAGKASAPMARAVEDLLGDRIKEGLISVKYGHTEPLRRIKLIEAGHPNPDGAGEAAARRIAAMAAQAGSDTLIINLISGGGSALLPLPFTSDDPALGIALTLADKQEVTKGLLASGADIGEINCVRKHLSALKGGRLLRLMAPAESLNFILSDVVGDRLDIIASGLTSPDRSTFADALAILQHYQLSDKVSPQVMRLLDLGCQGKIQETPKPGDPVAAYARNFLIGSNRAALLAACGKARGLGYHTVALTSSMTGEAREVAKLLFGIAKDVQDSALLVARPACIIAGGETVVTLRGGGKGGRNQEMALAFLVEMAKDESDGPPIDFLAASTDGSDGPTDAAGAFASSILLKRAKAQGLSPHVFLAENNSYAFFAAIEGLLKTGPTRTNVCDLQIITVGTPLQPC